MKNLNKKDLIYLWIIILSFLGLVFLLTNTTYLYGSTVDWYAQHISIPEYFRTLFYSTHEILPDFAFNIGSGQNIYNFSYYGLLSPIILISYFFPKVSMMTYLITATIFIVLISTILLYIFLKSKNYSSEVCMISSLSFIFSASISFHSHRHIMFISYMPFLILGLFGVDKIFKQNKSWLLIIGTFLMIMTNYYFSVGGIACIFLYAFYSYLNKMNKITLKTLINTFFKILCPIIIAILCSAIVTLPTFATLINNRADSNVIISLKDLLIPNLNLSNIIFNSYGLGFSAIIIPALLNLLTKDRNKRILGIILICLFVFNVFNYLLNGTMYIDGKSLIPFLPIYILALAQFIKDIFDKTVKYIALLPLIIIFSILVVITKKYLFCYSLEIIVLIVLIAIYNKFNKKILFIIPMFILVFVNCYVINSRDEFELKYTTKNNEKVVKSLINSVTEEDKDIYRITTNYSRGEFPNKIFNNINYYNSNIYSSISNQIYNKFYFDEAMNNIPSRNRALTVASSNVLYLLFSSNKYYISNGKGLIGYKLLTSKDNINLYENEQVLPIAYASSNLISYEDYEKLSDVEKQEALLNVIVADTKTENSFISNTREMILDIDDIFDNSNITKEDNGSYTIKVKDNLKISYDLPEKYHNKILFIRFKMNRVDEDKDLSITINTVKNKLTNKKWKYYNGNTVFDYVLAFQDQKKLNISFTEGEYNISDFETYYLDYAYVEKINDTIAPLIIDRNETKGDYIVGDIEVKENGYFMMTIPYDKGFNIKVDNNKVNYEKVDGSFIGFKIGRGKHHIEIEYKAPGKIISLWLCLIGVVFFIIVNVLESQRKI